METSSTQTRYLRREWLSWWYDKTARPITLGDLPAFQPPVSVAVFIRHNVSLDQKHQDSKEKIASYENIPPPRQ